MAIAFQQITAGTSSNSASSLTRSITPNAAGNLLVGSVGSNVPLTSFSDGTNTWDIDRSHGTSVRVYIGSAPNCSASAVTVTATFSSSGAVAMLVAEYSGIATSSHVDQVNSTNGFSTTANTGNITTTQADELLVAGFNRTTSSGTGIAEATGAGFTERSQTGGNRQISHQDRIVSSTGTYNASGVTLSGSNSDWTGAIVSYFGAAATGNRRRRVLIGAA